MRRPRKTDTDGADGREVLHTCNFKGVERADDRVQGSKYIQDANLVLVVRLSCTFLYRAPFAMYINMTIVFT